MNIADLPYETALPERYWSKVDENGPAPEHAPHLGNCWVWTAYVMPNGYGQFGIWKGDKHGMALVHRLSAIDAGIMTDGRMYVDHKCHVTHCVRPSHLREATNQQNSQNHKGASKRSTTGIRGVFWDKTRRKYVASVGVNGKYRTKRFNEKEDAEAQVIAWRQELMEFSYRDQLLAASG